MSGKWKYRRPAWYSESCARRDYERLRSEVERLRPVADIVDLSSELLRLRKNEQLQDELKEATDEIERLRGLLKKCQPYIEAGISECDTELCDAIEKEVGDEVSS